MKRNIRKAPEREVPWQYLSSCSDNALHDFWLARTFDAGNLRKCILAEICELIQIEKEAAIAEMMRTHGDTLATTAITRQHRLFPGRPADDCLEIAPPMKKLRGT